MTRFLNPANTDLATQCSNDQLLHPVAFNLHRLGWHVHPHFLDKRLLRSWGGMCFALDDTLELVSFDKYRGLPLEQVIIESESRVVDLERFAPVVRAQRFEIIAAKERELAAIRGKTKKEQETAQHERDLQPLKVHLTNLGNCVIDQGETMTLRACAVDWYSTLALKNKVVLGSMQNAVRSGLHKLPYFPMRIALAVVVLSSDAQVLLCLRNANLEDDPGRWSVPGENLDWGKDCEKDDESRIALRIPVTRVLNEHDEWACRKNSPQLPRLIAWRCQQVGIC